MDFLKRAKNEMRKGQADITVLPEKQLSQHRRKKLATIGITILLVAICCMTVALAADGDGQEIATLGKSAFEILKSVYSAVSGIITLLAAILLGIAWITRMTANPQKAAQATDWIKRILICYIGFFIMGLLFNVIENTTKDMHFNDNVTYEEAVKDVQASNSEKKPSTGNEKTGTETTG